MRAESREKASATGVSAGWQEILLAALMAAMALIAFLNVLTRYLVHYPLAFTEEVTVNLFVFATVVGSGLAFERGAQLGVVTLYRRFPLSIKRGVVGLSALLSAGLFVVLDIVLVQTVYREVTLFRTTSSSLGIPVWIYYAGVLLCTPSVFIGVWRGCRQQLLAESAGEAD